MTLNQLIAELQSFADRGHGDLSVEVDSDYYFYTPNVCLDAHGSLDDPQTEKYIRIYPSAS